MTKPNLNVAQWEELKDQYSEIVVDGMDLEDLVAYAQDQLRSYLDNLSYHELKEEIDNNDEELFDELVDNVTQVDEDVAEVEKCIIETNGEYAECVDHLLQSMEESK